MQHLDSSTNSCDWSGLKLATSEKSRNPVGYRSTLATLGKQCGIAIFTAYPTAKSQKKNDEYLKQTDL